MKALRWKPGTLRAALACKVVGHRLARTEGTHCEIAPDRWVHVWCCTRCGWSTPFGPPIGGKLAPGEAPPTGYAGGGWEAWR